MPPPVLVSMQVPLPLSSLQLAELQDSPACGGSLSAACSYTGFKDAQPAMGAVA